MRLLLLGCSQKKHLKRATMPAYLRYQGPAYRVLQKYIRECAHEELALVILSAAHGLISGQLLLGAYDQRLTPERTEQLKPQVQADLTEMLSRYAYDDIFVLMGKDYRELVADVLPPDTIFAEGGIGEKCSTLYHWLRKEI